MPCRRSGNSSPSAPRPAAENISSLFCKGLAFLRGRDYVTFDDVDDSAATVLGHRLILSDAAILEGIDSAELLGDILRGISPYAPAGR